MGVTRVTLNEAASIMDKKNFHGPTVVRKRLGINLRHRSFNTVPFGADVLQAVAYSHVLVAVPSVSIMDLHAKRSELFLTRHGLQRLAFGSNRDPWYGEPLQRIAFSEAKTEPGWYLLRKDHAWGSVSRDFPGQCVLVRPPDFVPEANLVVYAWILHYLATGERMFSRYWVRTHSQTAENDRHVRLRGDKGGLIISRWRDDAAGFGAPQSVGIASARKPS